MIYALLPSVTSGSLSMEMPSGRNQYWTILKKEALKRFSLSQRKPSLKQLSGSAHGDCQEIMVLEQEFLGMRSLS